MFDPISKFYVRWFNNMCSKVLNVCIYLSKAMGYEIEKKNDSASFIIDENELENGIENIIELLMISKDTDKQNLIAYLKHHIMYTNDKFHPMYFFDEPLVIRFKYRKETYKICLKQLESKNTDHSVIAKEPKILYGVLKTHSEDEGKQITDELNEFHGPERNFFKHIPDTISELSILSKYLENFENNELHKELHTFDMVGNQKVYRLSIPNLI